jgi:hypothetical protein
LNEIGVLSDGAAGSSAVDSTLTSLYVPINEIVEKIITIQYIRTKRMIMSNIKANVNVNIDSEIIDFATQLLERMGLDQTTAIDIFFRQIIALLCNCYLTQHKQSKN